MDSFLYVQEEVQNVERALDESLRFEYGPGQTKDYYEECRYRLRGIIDEIQRARIQSGSPTGLANTCDLLKTKSVRASVNYLPCAGLAGLHVVRCAAMQAPLLGAQPPQPDACAPSRSRHATLTDRPPLSAPQLL
jgi:hypothetical protein